MCNSLSCVSGGFWLIIFNLCFFQPSLALSPLFSFANEKPADVSSIALPVFNESNLPAKKTWAVVQYDNRELKGRIVELMNRNKFYCELHNCLYIFFNSGFENVPPYWRKVHIINKVLNMRTAKDGPRIFRGAMWLDTDAVIWDYIKFGLSELAPKHVAFVYGSDPEGLSVPSPFNAGVWIVRNSNAGRDIVHRWMSLYEPLQWVLGKDGKWKSKSWQWAGEDYEQGSFAKHMLGSLGLKEVPWYVLHGLPGKTDNQSFVFHFCGLANALGAGLVTVDRTILELLRIKYSQSLQAKMHATYMQYFRINFAVALLRFGAAYADYLAMEESERVLLDELEVDPNCELCQSNLKAVRGYLLQRRKPIGEL